MLVFNESTVSLPTVSVIIPTYNCKRSLKMCLKSIRSQTYPKNKIEIIIVDGGSEDSTIDVAKNFGAKVIVKKSYRDDQESRRAVGLFNAKNEILAYIDSDNVLPHRKWLLNMIKPLMESDKIIATQTVRYTYRRNDTLLNRYFALFGVNDPVVYYLNKRDQLSWAEDKWNLLGEVKDMGYYYLVKFTPESMPTLGCNGFIVRKEILMKANCEPPNFAHIDVNYDLIKIGYNVYGIVKDDIIHLTAGKIFDFLRKRMKYMKLYSPSRRNRRYKIYTSRDKENLLRYILYSLTVVKPLYDSSKGFRRIPDLAWFVHPVMCLLILFIYGLATSALK